MYKIFEKLMKERGVSVADVCRATGIKQSTMSNWKTRRNYITPENAMLIANYFGVTLDYLYGLVDDDSVDFRTKMVFESQLQLNGWEIEHDDPTIGKPCSECLEKQMERWGNFHDDADSVKLCKRCAAEDVKHIISKDGVKLVYSENDYTNLINKYRHSIDNLLIETSTNSIMNTSILNPEEVQIIETYRLLNGDGKDKTHDYVSDLLGNDSYRKDKNPDSREKMA